MLNQKRVAQVSWNYSDEEGGFVAESFENIKRGEQVFDSYGQKCSSKFLLSYGFINDDNDVNEVAIQVDTRQARGEGEIVDIKEKMLREPLFPKTFRILASMEDESTVGFMNFIRFVEIQDKATLLEVVVCYQNSMLC